MDKPVTVHGPYSPYREAGNLIFTAGQTGVDPATKSASTDLPAQVDTAMRNLSAVLASAGLGMADVVKTTVFLVDMNDFQAVNEVYLTFFEPPRPARSCVAVRELPRIAPGVDLKFEIEAIAVRR